MAQSRLKPHARSAGGNSSPLDGRLALLRDRMARLRLDAYLLTHAADIAYLTGFSGHDSTAVVFAKGPVVVVTDTRYTEELTRDAPQARLVLRKKTMAEALAPALRRISVARVGFETHFAQYGLIDGIRRQLRQAGLQVNLVPINDLLVALRAVKDPSELVHTRRAIDVAEAAFRKVVARVRPGVTEGWVAGSLILEMRSRGATDAAFQPIVAAGANSSLPHYRPTDTKVTANAPLLIDWGALVDGYRSDLTRTMFLGKVNPKLEKIYKVVLDANEAAIAALKPGMTGKAGDAVARNVIKKAGFGDYFGHGLGHGVGRDIHEEPRLHKSRDKEPLQPGHVVTVEPGIYLPGIGGVRIEDDVLITPTGCEVLTSIDKSLHWAKNAIGSSIGG